ncbi:hypothetical protein F4677DRAFT_275524 [Hypoxylon crocopeplum]|nr:hypothetical protein F4677DRAFT_275524 [Hypoxylon crocopeplum]
MLRYADVHLPPTYLRFPLAAPRYHIHGPNKTDLHSTSAAQARPLHLFPRFSTDVPFIAAVQSDAGSSSIVPPFAFCRRLQEGFVWGGQSVPLRSCDQL